MWPTPKDTTTLLRDWFAGREVPGLQALMDKTPPEERARIGYEYVLDVVIAERVKALQCPPRV